MNHEEIINKYLMMTQNELLILLAEEGSLGASRPSPQDGKRILENCIRALEYKICTSTQIYELYQNTEKPKVQLVGAILDCIAGAITGVSPIVVSVLLIKEGLKDICKTKWNEMYDK